MKNVSVVVIMKINELKKHFDEEIEISGFVDSVRNLQWVQFIVVRDGTEKVQVTIEKSEEKNKDLVTLVNDLKEHGVNINTDEMNFEKSYQIIIKLYKDNK